MVPGLESVRLIFRDLRELSHTHFDHEDWTGFNWLHLVFIFFLLTPNLTWPENCAPATSVGWPPETYGAKIRGPFFSYFPFFFSP